MRTFRILAALMMAVVCVGLSSCSKDDDEKIGSTDNIVGDWTITSDEGWELHEGEKDEWKDEDSDHFLKFYKDGTGTHADDQEFNPFTWYIDNNILTLNPTTSYYDEEVWTIKSLNANTLVLEMSGTDFYNKLTCKKK